MLESTKHTMAIMADLPNKLGEVNGVYMDKETRISSMIWADDIVLLSETENGLQDLLSKLSEYCEDNELTINVDKTKAMIFNKTGRLMRRIFLLETRKLKTSGNTNILALCSLIQAS